MSHCVSCLRGWSSAPALPAAWPLACLIPLLPRLPCVPCGSVCCAWCVCLACCVSLLPSCSCALPLACPASLCLCCLSLPWLLCGLACPDWPCSLLPGPLLSSPSALAAAIHLKVSSVYSWADIWPRLPGVSSFVRLALTHGLLCSLHGVLLVLCCSYGLELLPCHCLLPCLLRSGIKARMHRAFIFLKKNS